MKVMQKINFLYFYIGSFLALMSSNVFAISTGKEESLYATFDEMIEPGSFVHSGISIYLGIMSLRAWLTFFVNFNPSSTIKDLRGPILYTVLFLHWDDLTAMMMSVIPMGAI